MSTPRTNTTLGQYFVAMATCFLAVIPTAEAYLDPGTGSLMVQMAIGAVAAAGAAFTVYWHRIKALFGRSVETKRAEAAAMERKNDDSRPG